METGYIISYHREKKYGFINGDDNKKYFFHKNDWTDKKANIDDGRRVIFDTVATEKGYAAKKINYLQKGANTKVSNYILPDETYISKNKTVNGWETMEDSNWIVTGSSKDLEEAKEDVLLYASLIGGNALVEYRYSKITESESTSGGGTYHYTLHSFSGRVVTIAKISAHGDTKEEDFVLDYINNTAAEIFEEDRKKTKKSVLYGFVFTLLFAMIFTYIYYYGLPIFDNSFLTHLFEKPLSPRNRYMVLPIIGFVFFTFLYWKVFVKDHNEWLTYSEKTLL